MPRTVAPNPDAKQRITDALRGVESETLEKSTRIELRVTAAEKREIQTTASNLNLTVTDYVLSLHRAVRSRLTLERKVKGREQRANSGENTNG